MKRNKQSGIILLVVLSMLTFFSLLVAAYLVFSSEARVSSVAIAERNIKQPDPNFWIDQAFVKLMSGTDNGDDPFFGMDLLSDYYGRQDGGAATVAADASEFGNQDAFVLVPVTVPASLGAAGRNGALAGRILTFTSGQLANQSFRVVHSFHDTGGNHDVVLRVRDGLVPDDIDGGTTCWFNGHPRTSRGLGFNGTSIDATETIGGVQIPRSFVPNRRGKNSWIAVQGSDFDEGSDVADYNDHFLCYEHADGKVIPSFLRPSVVNYLLNQYNYPADYDRVMEAIEASTLRPLPFDNVTNPNPNFTGGNANFGLRANLSIDNAAKLDQVARVLTGAASNPWDVDNTGNGRTDSVWTQLNLPIFTAPDGRLLRAMVAPRIEDLSGRLNVNTAHNARLSPTVPGIQLTGHWGGTSTASGRRVFQGLGYGPSEIVIPFDAVAGDLVEERQRLGWTSSTSVVPGIAGDDVLDQISNGWRPMNQTADSGMGGSTDPFGWGGIAVGRSGQVTQVFNSIINARNDDPYELDPSGRLAGDRVFTPEELEAVLRANYFDTDQLPDRLNQLVGNTAGRERLFTTTSVSDDSPPNDGFEGVAAAALPTILAPELKIGRKLDVNRRFGNRVDDDNDGIIDEPEEITDSEASVTSAFQTAGNGGGPNTGMIPGEMNARPDYRMSIAASGGRELLARHLYTLMMSRTRDNLNAYPSHDPNGPNTSPAYRARRIAQWAVNAVDYRDPDSIMTRFQYDVNPLDGWSPGADTVVWGVESPELLFSEATGFHDTRVRDTAAEAANAHPASVKNDDNTTDEDHDVDQFRIPQGSLFLEFVSTRQAVRVNPTANAGVPRELYTNNNRLDLGRRAGANNSPVYRVAFSQPHYDAAGDRDAAPNSADDPFTARDTLPDSYSFDLMRPDELTAGAAGLTYDRYLCFTDTPPQIAGMTDVNTFCVAGNAADNADRSLEPGQYLVVAPRVDTRFGSVAATPPTPSEKRLQYVAGDGLVEYAENGNAVNPAVTYHPPKVLVAGTAPPIGWAAGIFAGDRVGLNVSEPMPRSGSYYPQPDLTVPGYTLIDGYTNILDLPADANFDRIPMISRDAAFAGDATNPPDDEEFDPILGTIPQYCSAFLQRLADPTRGYNQATNPYITVDWMPIDLTVYSGDERAADVYAGSLYHRRSRQRNGHVRSRVDNGTVIGLEPTPANALFSHETHVDEIDQTLAAAGTEYFSFTGVAAGDAFWQHSLGFLNTADTALNPGFEGFTPALTGAAGTDRNLPRRPFALHSWLNRPYASPYELMLVPACSQARLQAEFTIPRTAEIITATSGGGTTQFNAPGHLLVDDDLVVLRSDSGPSNLGVFRVTGATVDDFTLTQLGSAATPFTGAVTLPAQVVRVQPSEEFHGPFRHLLNFFHSDADPANQAGFAEIFDYVRTPPPYRGEREFFPPRDFPTFTSLGDAESPWPFAAPMNHFSRNVRLGQVNLNALAQLHVWRGLMFGHMTGDEASEDAVASDADTPQMAFARFLESRRGYALNESENRVVDSPGGALVAGPFNYDPAHLHSEYPTQFAGRFQRFSQAGLAPDLGGDTRLLQQGLGGTMLRPFRSFFSSSDEFGDSANHSFFERYSIDGVPSLGFRNPVTHLQGVTRMPNLTSDNSQVFAIWLTVGFFEVDPNNTSAVGAEYRESEGMNERYQALFIVDRSVPVGFIPGQPTNVRDTIIFQRYFQ